MINLVEKKKCSGCTACVACCPQNAIIMTFDTEGFKYPVIDRKKCIECGKCLRTCPILNKQKTNKVTLSYIAINKEKKQRLKSASGGIFSVIALNVLEHGGVVFGAAYDADFQVRHIAIEDKKDLHKLQMSKYVQSDLDGVFNSVENYLKKGRLVLFSGTPCQVAGLKAYYNNEDSNLILLDLVCHGVPSPELFEEYKKALKEEYKSDIENIYFRSKVLGHHLSTIAVSFSDGKLRHSTRLIKSYPRLWFAGYSSRPSCYACSFKEEDRVSDFTIFDSFKSADYYGFNDDDLGLSNVYIRTQKACGIWEEIQDRIMAVKTDIAITNQNDGDMIFESAEQNMNRKDFWNDYEMLSYNDLIEKYIPYSFKERLMDYIKRVLVTTHAINDIRIKKLLIKMKK